MIEPRRWYWLRLELIGYTLVAAFTALAMAFLIVLGPLMLEAARRHIPLIVETNEQFLNVARYGITIAALIVALFILHAWLPAGRRGFLQILPGIVFTLVASLVSGIVFGQYLARFANNYVTMYAGPRLGHHRAGVSVFHRRDLRLWRRTERGDHQVAAAARRVASSSAVARALGLTGLTRKASAPAARDAASSSPRPDTPMIAMRPNGGLKRANSPDRLDAVDARQHHVHQHRVEVALRDPLGGGLAAPDEFRLMAEFGEDRIEHDAAERIVLDAENAQRRAPASTAHRHRRPNWPPSAPWRGSSVTVSVKVVPPPRRCATTMSPPIARASCFTDDSPSPAPPKREAMRDIGLRERAEQPLDLVQREADPAVGNRKGDADLAFAAAHRRDRRARRRRCSVNFTALSIRFSSAARRRTGSPTTSAGSFSEISTWDCRPLAAARPASESPALRASARRSNKSCRTPAARDRRCCAASTNKVARLARCSAPALMVSTQRRSRSSRSEVARRSLMARIPVSGVRTSWANAASAASTMPGPAQPLAARWRALPAASAWSALFRRPLLRRRVVRCERDFGAMISLTLAASTMPWPGARSHAEAGFSPCDRRYGKAAAG